MENIKFEIISTTRSKIIFKIIMYNNKSEYCTNLSINRKNTEDLIETLNFIEKDPTEHIIYENDDYFGIEFNNFSFDSSTYFNKKYKYVFTVKTKNILIFVPFNSKISKQLKSFLCELIDIFNDK